MKNTSYKTNTLTSSFRRPFGLVLMVSSIVIAGLFSSCGGVDNSDKVAELQRQLDSTLSQYQNLKMSAGDYEEQLSSRDSAINAQAAEIQRLINELNNAKRRPAAASATNNDARIERQQKEIREKENTIRQLQRQIDQQTKQIAELSKAGQTGTQIDGQQKKELSKLQSKIDEQQKQIATLQNDIKRLRDENTSATQGKDKMKKDYESQLATVNGQLESCRAELSRVNEQIKAKNAEISHLVSQGNSVPDENAELKQLRIQVNDLNKKEAACRKQYEELQKNVEQSSSLCESDKQALQNQINSLNQQVQTLQARTTELQTQNAELVRNAGQSGDAQAASYQKTIDDLNAQIGQQRQQIAQLQSDLQQKNQELEAAKKESGKKTDVGTVSQKIQELQQLCDSYLAEIERLRAENELLKNENAELKGRVSNSADLIAENERLQQKVKLASVLVTDDMKITPGKELRPGNFVKSTNKAKQVKVIRIDCRILDNNVVDPGSITIYARIANAANRVVANGQPESFDMSGVQMQYTMKQDIEFTGYGRNLAMIWKKYDDVELAPGLYWVTLYAGGYEIGKVSFKLD